MSRISKSRDSTVGSWGRMCRQLQKIRSIFPLYIIIIRLWRDGWLPLCSDFMREGKSRESEQSFGNARSVPFVWWKHMQASDPRSLEWTFHLYLLTTDTLWPINFSPLLRFHTQYLLYSDSRINTIAESKTTLFRGLTLREYPKQKTKLIHVLAVHKFVSLVENNTCIEE